jgi:PAS domain S-box-containing protein
MYGAIPGAVILVGLLWGQTAHWKLILWLGCFVAVQVPRHLIAYRFEKTSPTGEDAIPWGPRFAIPSALTALIWGSTAVFLFPSGSEIHQFALALFLVGVACSSATAHSPLKECYIPSILLVMLPLCLRCIVAAQGTQLVIGIAGLVLTAALVGSATAMETTTVDALKLRFEKTDLLNDSALRKAEVKGLKEDLRTEISRRGKRERTLKESGEQLEAQVREQSAELKAAEEKLRTAVTEFKQVEEALRESEERCRALTRNALTGIFIHQDGVLTFVNGRLAEMGGYTPKEMLGREFLEFIHPDERDELRKRALARLQGESVPSRYEFRFLCKDGLHRWAEVLTAVIPYRGRTAIMGNVADITDRKRALEAVHQSEEKYRNVVENANEAIMVAQEGKLRFVNPKAAKVIGLSREQMTLKPMEELIHPDDRAMVLERHRRRIVGESPPSIYAFRIIDGDGSVKWVEINAVLIDWEGRPATLNFLTDITARRQMEEELLKVQKLESVGLLAGGIAHDFNNILTAILGNISVAKMQLPPEERARPRLEAAERAALDAQSLTRQLLTFSRGGAPIKQLSNIAETIDDTCRFALRGSNVAYESSVQKNLRAVEIDQGQINQVINNLVINADQAMPDGGSVRVSVENVTVGSDDGLPLEPGEYLRLSIRDTGPGIPEEDLPKIFDPYFTTKEKGSGLGLTTSYSIIKNHGGFITVESDLGQGAAFHIYLPASDAQVDHDPESGGISPVGGAKILVMDDEESIRETSSQMLTMIGFEVETAEDGDRAIELYQAAMEASDPFDAVIMDLTIPGGTGGIEAIHRLRELHPEVKAIVSSGYSNDPIMSEYEKHGFNGVVTKPYTARELVKTLTRILTPSND